jgi:hypothetical protein
MCSLCSLVANSREPILWSAFARPDTRLQIFNEQARDRRTRATIPRSGGNAKSMFALNKAIESTTQFFVQNPFNRTNRHSVHGHKVLRSIAAGSREPENTEKPAKTRKPDTITG